MNNKNIKIEAKGDFPFQFYIEKAVASGTEEEMTIKGVASTVNIDHDNERMSLDALKSMAEVINESSVPLRVEHQKNDNAIVGSVHKAWVDERNQLWIEALLDKSHPASGILYKSLKEGVKLGLSVGGRVKSAVKEFSESAGKMVKTFYQVALDEVSVTQRPANYDAWLLAKSIIKDKNEDTTALYDSPLYKDFIFETRGLDYMQSFAKSIPDGSWKRIETLETNNEKDMTQDKEVKKSEEMTEEEKKKAMETDVEEETNTKKHQEDEAFKSYVVKGFETLGNILSKLTKNDSTTEEEKEKNMDDTSETKEKSAEETTEEEKKKSSDKTDETKEKNMDETTEDKKEKSQDETDETKKGDYGSEYKMKSIIDRLTKMSETPEEKEKNMDDKEEETTKSQKISSIDTFVELLEKSMDALEEKNNGKGMKVMGLREMLMDVIRNDGELQKSIKDMVAEPGQKKSVIMGQPFMKSKEGKMYRLTAESTETVEKSKKDNAGKSFKDVYKSQYSTVAEAERMSE